MAYSFFFLLTGCVGLRFIIATLSKPRRRRQRGHGKTKDLMSRTIAQHVRLYISEPSYTKQQREITKTATANYFNFHLELNASFLRYGEVKVWRRMRR